MNTGNPFPQVLQKRTSKGTDDVDSDAVYQACSIKKEKESVSEKEKRERAAAARSLVCTAYMSIYHVLTRRLFDNLRSSYPDSHEDILNAHQQPKTRTVDSNIFYALKYKNKIT